MANPTVTSNPNNWSFWSSVSQYHLGLALPKWLESGFVVGPWCNRTIGGLGSMNGPHFVNRLGLFIEFDPLQKAPFSGVRDLVPVMRSGVEETPGYLGGWLRTHAGHGASKLVELNVLGSGKNAKTAQIRVAVFTLSYSYSYAALRLFLTPMGQYRSMLLNTRSTDFICIAESNLHLLYASK